MDVSKHSFLKRGKAVLATAEAELAKAKAKLAQPPVYRFWIPDGAETEAVILDTSFEEAVGLYEHNIQDVNGHWGNYVGCTRENCSLCQIHGESYYLIFLTILVLREYVKKSGEIISFTKMLLPIKLSLLPQFQVISTAAMKEAGTLRGTCAKVKRESFSPAIWRFGKVLAEKTLIKNYGRTNATPFDYSEVFTKWAQ